MARILLVENDQLILGTGQLSDTDCIAAKHPGRNISRVIAGTKNCDPGSWDLPEQVLEIAQNVVRPGARRPRLKAVWRFEVLLCARHIFLIGTI
jgi:hypothetical protein